MKKILLLTAILIWVYLPAQNWKTYTNTNHIYDLSAKDNDLYVAIPGWSVKAWP